MTNAATGLTAREVVNRFLADCGNSHDGLTAAVDTSQFPALFCA